MKYLLFVFLLVGTCSTEKEGTNKGEPTSYTITGKIIQKSTYCGGARPSPELLESFKTPKPLKNFKVYLKAGKTNADNAKVIASTSTDELGRYSFNVQAGDYVLVSETQLNRSNFDGSTKSKYLKITDEACLQAWYEKGMMTCTIKDRNQENPDHLINKKCDVPEGMPCLVYTGPVRP